MLLPPPSRSVLRLDADEGRKRLRLFPSRPILGPILGPIFPCKTRSTGFVCYRNVSSVPSLQLHQREKKGSDALTWPQPFTVFSFCFNIYWNMLICSHFWSTRVVNIRLRFNVQRIGQVLVFRWLKSLKSGSFLPFRGRFSVVKRCDHRGTKRTVAVKQVNKKLMRRDRVTQELNLLWRLQHPHIVSLIDTYETPSSYALVLEMCVHKQPSNQFYHLRLPSSPVLTFAWRFRADQGRLLDYIVSWGNLTEEKVACYLRNVLEALHYLHNCRIVHLDVKVSSSSFCSTLESFSQNGWHAGCKMVSSVAFCFLRD